MIGIFLDDERNPEDVTWINYNNDIEWIIVRNMVDFIFEINDLTEDYCISLDHDIQDYTYDNIENTGYDCIKYLVNYCMDNNQSLPFGYFHTQNPIGKENMQKYYLNALKFMEN